MFLVRFLRAVAGLTVMALMATACGSDNGGTSSVTTPVPTPTPAAESTATAVPAAATATAMPALPTPTSPYGPPTQAVRESSDVPRSITYSDMTFTLTKAVLTNESPRTYGRAGQEELLGSTQLYLHLRVQNELRNVPQAVRATMFQLDVSGTRATAINVSSQVGGVNVQPGSAGNYLAGFEVPEGVEFTSLTLVVAEPGTLAAMMPLAGPVAEMPYPIAATIETDSRQVTSRNPCGTTMVVQPLRAEVDVDALTDHRGLTGSIEDGRRTLEGERFLRIAARVTGDSGQCGGANVVSEGFRLRIDGVPRAPVSYLNSIVRIGQGTDIEVLYRVPVTATDLVLLAGQPDGLVAEYVVTIDNFGP